MRTGVFLLGLGLAALAAAALLRGAVEWPAALVAVGALLALATNLLPGTRGEQALRRVPFLLAAYHLLVWGGALAAGSERWLAWWTFGFGLAFLLLGAATAIPEDRFRRDVTPGVPRRVP